MYASSIGVSVNVGAGLVAGFSLASTVGRIASGVMSDRLGSFNTVVASLLLTAITNLTICPTSTTLAAVISFVVIRGAANGAFFSTMPTALSKGLEAQEQQSNYSDRMDRRILNGEAPPSFLFLVIQQGICAHRPLLTVSTE